MATSVKPTAATNGDLAGRTHPAAALHEQVEATVPVRVEGEELEPAELAGKPGRGAHVANAGYMVEAEARGQGLATALCEHSIDTARRRGYRAMQFNFVVGTNRSAIRVWERCGFAVVGRLPGVFQHRTEGLVDALVFHRGL